MALSPLAPANEGRVIETEETLAPSKTYRLSIDSNVIGGFIDSDEAIRQFVAKAVRTARERFLIYDDQYGSELESLVGQDLSPELLETGIPRMIRESLIYDGRVTNVNNFAINRVNDKLYVTFSVVTINDVIFDEEVTL